MRVLKRERLRRGWSLTKVCGLTGIAPSDLSLLERGLQPAYPGWRRRLAKAFRMPAADLFAEVSEEAPAATSARTRIVRGAPAE